MDDWQCMNFNLIIHVSSWWSFITHCVAWQQTLVVTIYHAQISHILFHLSQRYCKHGLRNICIVEKSMIVMAEIEKLHDIINIINWFFPSGTFTNTCITDQWMICQIKITIFQWSVRKNYNISMICQIKITIFHWSVR